MSASKGSFAEIFASPTAQQSRLKSNFLTELRPELKLNLTEKISNLISSPLSLQYEKPALPTVVSKFVPSINQDESASGIVETEDEGT